MAGREPGDDADVAADGLRGLSLSDRAATTATPTSMSIVLDNEDLLLEIFLRLGLPNNLVRASLVCKRWLRNASDPLLLRLFHELHPPRLLGFYMVADGRMHPQFVRLHGQPPELGTLLDRASNHFSTWVDVPVTMWDCRNGQLLVDICGKLAVHSPLLPPFEFAIYPQSPLKMCLDRSFKYDILEFLPENGGNGRDYYRLALGYRRGMIVVFLLLFVGGIWVVRRSKLTPFPVLEEVSDFAAPFGILGRGRMYAMTTCRVIIVLDIETIELTMVELLDEMNLEDCNDINLSQAELADEFNLICRHPLKLDVWVHNMTTGHWRLSYSISIHDILRRFGISGPEIRKDSEEQVSMYAAGEVGEFVLLGARNSIFLFNINGKSIKEVYQMCPEDGELQRLYPFMMMWPPTFPEDLIRRVKLEQLMLMEGPDTNTNMLPEDITYYMHHEDDSISLGVGECDGCGCVISEARISRTTV